MPLPLLNGYFSSHGQRGEISIIRKRVTTQTKDDPFRFRRSSLGRPFFLRASSFYFTLFICRIYLQRLTYSASKWKVFKAYLPRPTSTCSFSGATNGEACVIVVSPASVKKALANKQEQKCPVSSYLSSSKLSIFFQVMDQQKIFHKMSIPTLHFDLERNFFQVIPFL